MLYGHTTENTAIIAKCTKTTLMPRSLCQSAQRSLRYKCYIYLRATVMNKQNTEKELNQEKHKKIKPEKKQKIKPGKQNTLKV